MKTSKKIGFCSLLLVFLFCLSGCYALTSDINVNYDGSGNMNFKIGYSVDTYQSGLNALNDQNIEVENLDQLQTFQYNGKYYVGETESKSFASLSQLNAYMNDYTQLMLAGNSSYDDGYPSQLSFNCQGNYFGGFTFTAAIPTKPDKELGGTNYSYNDLDQYILTHQNELQDYVINLSLSFPWEVQQVEGPSAGVSIYGNNLSFSIDSVIDYVTAQQSRGQSFSDPLIFTFVANPPPPPEEEEEIPVIEDPYMFDDPYYTLPVDSGFSDVILMNNMYSGISSSNSRFADLDSTAWYNTAVNAMVSKGFMNGFEDSLFHPNDSMTYAQFCTLLKRICDDTIGTSSYTPTSSGSYWAYEAIDYCLSNNYISYSWNITPAVYDAPIPREAAIAAITRWYVEYNNLEVYSPENIGYIRMMYQPTDSYAISAEYIDDICIAYYLGLSNGVDEYGTFAPTS